MNVWYLVFIPDSLTYTIAKALSFGGHDTSVLVTNPEQPKGGLAGAIPRRLRETPHVSFVARGEAALPPAIERLIVQVFPRPAESLQHIHPLAKRARRITIVTAGDRSRSWRNAIKQQSAEVRGLALQLTKVDRAVYKDGFYPRDLFGFIKPRSVVGFDAHSQFLHDPTLYDAMHARDWNPDTRRPITANFLGSRDPPVREHILADVRPFFQSAGAKPVSDNGAKSMYWHEYPDADPVGVPPLDFVKVLTQSDFTLCPRGYSVVTHRPIEALLRGSIPVLPDNETDLYGIKLDDGVNCIGVASGGWPKVMERLRRIDEQKLVQMRMTAAEMFASHLDYNALARGIRERVGVDG